PLAGMRAIDRRHPLGWDLGLAAAVALVSVNAGPPSGPVGWAVFAVVHAAVVLRRRRPQPAPLGAGAAVAAARLGPLPAPPPPPWTSRAVWVLLFGPALRGRRRGPLAPPVGAAALVAVCSLVAPPIAGPVTPREHVTLTLAVTGTSAAGRARGAPRGRRSDRKSTRLNSSHVKISYAAFCSKHKNMRDMFLRTMTMS